MLASYNSSTKSFTEQHPRLTNHLALAGLTLIGCLISAIFATPGQDILETMSVGTGYVGLLLIFASLVIGPINMLKVRKNPVNIMVRRDVGIWAGITSLIHVFFSGALQLSWGDSLLGLFFYKNGGLKLNLFGISNIFGLVGALTVLFLMVLSNNYFLKKLKGKNWKKMQRFNYLLFGVALVHTFTQQLNNVRGISMVIGVMALALGVMVAQAIGFVIYRKREQQRKPAAAPKSAQPVAAQVAMAQPARVSRVEAPRYSAPVAPRQSSSLPKAAMYAVAGILTLFAGFEIGQQGSQLVNSVVTANNSNTTSASSSSNTVNSSSTISNSSSTSSSSSSSATVQSPSSSQPSVRSQHS